MHFTQRDQQALRDAGVDQSALEAASEAVVEATAEAAADLEAFFEGRETVSSDMDIAHSSSDIQTHQLAYVDLYTHADDIRGYIRFDSWGVPVEGGRVLTDEKVELTLGPTVDDRVRFAAAEDAL
jgi:alpha-D-ribose 1-methylphosphonate 5-triphosphate diphosphatase PhnM